MTQPRWISFFYLSSYPFGNNREAGEMPGYTFYRVPDGFEPDGRLQRLFIQKLLARIELVLNTPFEAVATRRYSDPAQMWLALTRLEKQIQDFLPDLAEPSSQARGKLFALLPQSSQTRVDRVIDDDNRPKKSFEEQVEAAEKLTDVARRDQQLSFAVTGAPAAEAVERVVGVIDKISDTAVRGPLLNWFYFFRSQSLIKDKKLEEAKKIAARVTELDQRAYLYSRIAEESLKESQDQIQARETLNEIADAAAKIAHHYCYSTSITCAGLSLLKNRHKSRS